MNCKECGVEIFGYSHKKYCKECKKKAVKRNYKKYYNRPEIKERMSKNAKQYNIDNSEEQNKKSRQYYKDNIEKIRIKNKIRSQRPEDKKRAREYQRKRRKNPLVRMNHNIGTAVYLTLKENRACKNGRKWEDLLGYTRDDLRLHLEKQFTEGMSWDNYGKWHIDHIIPKSFFKYESTDDVEFCMCWRLENLQPLWAFDNISKNNSL